MFYKRDGVILALSTVVLGLIVFAATGLAEERVLIAERPTPNDSLANKLNGLELNLMQLKREINVLREQLQDKTPMVASSPTVADSNNSALLAGRDGGIYLPSNDLLAMNSNSLPARHEAEAVAISIPESKPLEISGFLDAVYQVHSQKDAPNTAAINQLELDLSHELNDRTTIALSVCYDKDFFLGAANINYNLYQADESDPATAFSLSNWSVMGGQFDIPFGLDYKVYASIDRMSISIPSVVEQTHNRWNDVGILNSIGIGIGSLDAYVVKGFGSRYWNDSSPYTPDVSDDDSRWSDYESNVSSGLRLNLSLIPGVDVGTSVARGWLTNGGRAMSLIGVHSEVQSSLFQLKGEAILCQKAESLQKETVRGSYLECQKSVGSFYGFERFDYVDDRQIGQSRYWSTGLGVTIRQGLECRSEYRADVSGLDNRFLLQIAAGF